MEYTSQMKAIQQQHQKLCPYCIQHKNWLPTIMTVSHGCLKTLAALWKILVKSWGSKSSQHKSQELFGGCSHCRKSTGEAASPAVCPCMWDKHTGGNLPHTVSGFCLSIQEEKIVVLPQKVRRLKWTDTRMSTGIFLWAHLVKVGQQGLAKGTA